MRVEQFYNKNQFIITDNENGKIVFQSYDSKIAEIDKEGNLTLFRDFDYSHTTRKHLYLFLSDYRYNMVLDLQYKIFVVLNSKNKRKALQRLIDSGEIAYKDED